MMKVYNNADRGAFTTPGTDDAANIILFSLGFRNP